MAHHPKASSQLAQHQPRPHSYQSTPEIQREADKLLEQLVDELVKTRGLTREAARKHLRHWV